MTLISPENYLVTVIIVPLAFTNSILMVYSEAAYIALSEVPTYLPKLTYCLLDTMSLDNYTAKFYHTYTFKFILKNCTGGKAITLENIEFNHVWSCGTNTKRRKLAALVQLFLKYVPI